VTLDRVTRRLTQLLRLSSCRFDYGSGILGGRRPRLRADGQLDIAGTPYDVDRLGLPSDQEIELPVGDGRRYRGCFLMTAGPGSRPSFVRLVAVALAERVAAALGDGAAVDP